MSHELSPAELARAQARREDVLRHMPQMVPVIRDLVAEGLIEGWRSVVYCGPVDGGPDPHPYNAPGNGREIIEWKERHRA